MRPLTKAEQRLRDKLLRESGFVDLEDEHGTMRMSETGVLGDHGSRRSLKRLEARIEEIQTEAEYYRRAGQLVHEHPWRTPVERRIWELHAEGATYTRIWRTVKREIELGELPREKMYRRRVHATVTRVRAIMMGAVGKKRGRPVQPDSMRQEGAELHVRLDRASMLALDRIRSVLQVKAPQEAIRLALKRLAANSGSP